MSDTVWLKMELIEEREKSYKVRHENEGRHVWVPKSTIEDMTIDHTVGDGEVIDVEMKKWKAVEMGWA